MQRVDVPVLDGPARRDQRLARHLAAEHALAVLVGAQPAEEVDLELLQREQVDQLVECGAHERAGYVSGCD